MKGTEHKIEMKQFTKSCLGDVNEEKDLNKMREQQDEGRDQTLKNEN